MALTTFQIGLVPDDGETIHVTADTRDICMWEKVDKANTFAKLADTPSMSAFYSLAHVAARRRGLTDMPLDDFVDRYALDLDATDADPTSEDHEHGS